MARGLSRNVRYAQNLVTHHGQGPFVNPNLKKSLILNAISNFVTGDVFNITWSSSRVNSIDLEYDNGSGWVSIDTDVDASLSLYSWDTTGLTRNIGGLSVRIKDHDAPAEVFSTRTGISVFDPSITLGTIADFTEGDTFSITWTKQDVTSVKLQYDIGAGWVDITTGKTGTSYSWDTTGIGTGTLSVRVVDEYDSTVSDTQTGITVSSASTRYQIDATDCDVYVYDSIESTSGKIVVSCYVVATANNPTVGGTTISINSGVGCWALVQIDLSDGSVDWVNSKLNNSHTYYPALGQGIISDGTYLYCSIFSNEGGNYKNYVRKIDIATGSTQGTDLQVATNTTSRYGALTILSGNIYHVLMVQTDVRLYKMNTSLTIDNTQTLGASSSGTLSYQVPHGIGNDGTDIYVSGRSRTMATNAIIMKINAANTTQATEHTIASGATTSSSVIGYYGGSSVEYISIIGYNTAWGDTKKTTDQTNDNTTLCGRLSYVGSELFVFEFSSPYGSTNITDYSLIDTSDMSTEWSKDTSVDSFRVEDAVYTDSKYWVVGACNDDFDGSHSGNTQYKISIGLINMSDGSY